MNTPCNCSQDTTRALVYLQFAYLARPLRLHLSFAFECAIVPDARSVILPVFRRFPLNLFRRFQFLQDFMVQWPRLHQQSIRLPTNSFSCLVIAAFNLRFSAFKASTLIIGSFAEFSLLSDTFPVISCMAGFTKFPQL